MADDILFPILGAVLAGGLIGFEREYRGRAAGFRTHILVALASTLLMLAATHQAEWSYAAIPGSEIVGDPTRMAHGILTGIGFLCAGVIFREGFSVHGLTTAASLWMVSALGVLFGAGLTGLGAVGTGVTLAILVALRMVNQHMPARTVVDITLDSRRDSGLTREALEAALEGLDVTLGGGGYTLRDNGTVLRRRFKARMRRRVPVETLADRLAGLPEVTGFDLRPRAD